MAKLVVEVLNARDLLPTDHHGSASPFVEVEFDGRRQRTQTKTRDLYPTWNEKLAFDIQNPRNLPNSIIGITVYDDRRADHHKGGYLGRVQISGTSVSLLESEAAVQIFPLCKGDSFSHGRGNISLRIYTVRAQYYYGNQQPRRRLNIKKAPKLEENKHKGGERRRDEENETRNSDSDGSCGGIIAHHQNLTDTSSGVYFTPIMYYLRVAVIEAQSLALCDNNRQPEFRVRLQLGNQTRETRPSTSLDGNPIWNEELLFVTSEPLDGFLFINAVDRIMPGKDELIGRTVMPISSIPQRFYFTDPVQARWSLLNEEGDNKKKQAGKILLRLCLEAGYHVSDGPHGDFQPSAKPLKKDRIGTLELAILSARGLPPMKKQTDGGAATTNAYCIALYGNKWVRTRSVVSSVEPYWNEKYAWEVYDPCTVITIGVFHNGNVDESRKDLRIGKVLIPVQTLEVNRIHTQHYPLLFLGPSGLQNHGRLQVAVQFTCVAWANMFSQYTKTLFPRMHYLRPVSVRERNFLRHYALQIVAAYLSKAEPPIKRECVEYMLDEYHMWSVRKQRANFERLMSLVLGVTPVFRWLDEICHWRNPLKTIFIHFFYLALVWYPNLILPIIFLTLSIMGMWNYRFRPRNPPHFDARLSRAETVDPDHLDEEFDTFPTSRPSEIVRWRYDRLRSIAGRFQTMVGDIATFGEKAKAILEWRDTRATPIFTVIAFIGVVFMYMAPFRVVATLLGLYWLRPPLLRNNMPSLLVNLFTRLPSKMDSMMLL